MYTRRVIYLSVLAMIFFGLASDTTCAYGTSPVLVDASSVASADDSWSATVNTGNLNMRAGPGAGYDIVETYPRGTYVVVSGRNQAATWLKVKTLDGTHGWMSARYLRYGFDKSELPVVGIESSDSATPTQPTSDGAAIRQIVVPENDTSPGPLPVLYYALTEPSGADVYPLGENSYALFAVYDSGTTKVRVSKILPNRITGPSWGKSDADHLNLYSVEEVNIRLNGLQEARADGSIPIGTPGSQNAPQVEVRDIWIKPDRPDVTLIGTSIVNQIVAHIDNTTRIDEALFTHALGPVRAPHIELYWPGDSRIPATDVALPLEFFGNRVSTDGATAGYRYWIRGVTLNNNGNAVSDTARGLNFLYDTGSTVTIVNDQIAAWLGLSSMQPKFDCLSGTDNGYIVDSVVMTAADGSYMIEDASICWSDANIITAPADAVIGSNLFKSVELVLNGPAATLGIIGPAGSVTQSDASSPGGNSGFSGVVLDRDSGVAIQGARIIFEREDGSLRRETTSASNGAYRIELPPVRYYVRAEHDDYATYTTGSGFFVVTGGSFQTGNIFMERRATSDPDESAGCQGTEVGGYCWYFGGDSVSCQDVCAEYGGYDEATRTFAGSDGSTGNCRAVIDGLGISIDRFHETRQGGLGCFVIRLTTGNYGGFWDTHPTTAEGVYVTPGRRRLCACKAETSELHPTDPIAGLYDTLMAKIVASTQNNEYPHETELFVRHLAADLSAHATAGGDQVAVVDALRTQHDVGDRINALVHRTWKDWEAYGIDHMSADPGQHGQSPLRQLVIRLTQGSQGQLTSTDLRAIHNSITRGWDGDIRGLIGAVNRDIYGW